MTENGFKRRVTLVSAASLAATLGLLVLIFGSSRDIAPPPPDAAAPHEAAAPPEPPQPAELTRTILGNDIFGLKPTAGDRAVQAAPPKPAEIDMELTGTVVTADPARNVAFLRDKAGKSQKPYLVGATVKDARIKSIGKNFVILTRQGRDEILSMKP